MRYVHSFLWTINAMFAGEAILRGDTGFVIAHLVAVAISSLAYTSVVEREARKEDA